MNGWKFISMVLVLIMIGLAVVSITQNNQSISLDTINIPADDFKSIVDPIPNNYQYALCSISDNKCISLIKRRLSK